MTTEGGFNVPWPGCAFEKKAKRRKMNMKPTFFNAHTLYSKATKIPAVRKQEYNPS
jgi:hypothetical protein